MTETTPADKTEHMPRYMFNIEVLGAHMQGREVFADYLRYSKAPDGTVWVSLYVEGDDDPDPIDPDNEPTPVFMIPEKNVLYIERKRAVYAEDDADA